MDINWAKEQLENGSCVRRDGWDEGCFIFIVKGVKFEVEKGRMLDEVFPVKTGIEMLTHVAVSNTNDTTEEYWIAPWNPRVEDIFYDDWRLVEIKHKFSLVK